MLSNLKKYFKAAKNETETPIETNDNVDALPSSSKHEVQAPRITTRPRKAWTQKEKDFVSTHYTTLTDEQIGKVLDRSRPAVTILRRKLGLLKDTYTVQKAIGLNGTFDENAIARIAPSTGRKKMTIRRAKQPSTE